MSNTQITDLFSVRPIERVRPYSLYLGLPAFDSFAAPAWKGASEVALQYCFSSSYNFTILNRPTKPTGVTFGLCIRWRVGDVVTRYKLWQDDAFILNDEEAPLYNGQKILKNFVLEIWTLEGVDEIENTEAIQMLTGKTIVPANLTDRDNRTLVEIAETLVYSQLLNTNDLAPSPALENALCWFDAENGITKDGSDLVSYWFDKLNLNDLIQANGANQPIWFADGGASISNKPFINLQDSARFLKGDNSILCNHWFMVVNQNTWTNGRFLIEQGAPSAVQITGTPTVRFGGPTVVINSAGLTLGTWYILSVAQVWDASSGRTAIYVDTWSIAGQHLVNLEDTSGADVQAAAQLVLGNDSGASSGDFYIAEFLGYGEMLTDAQRDQVVSYLSWKYSGSVNTSLPMQFNPDVAWLDNEE